MTTQRDVGTEVSLQDYNASTPTPGRRRRCLLCTIPLELEREIVAGKQAGITYRVIGEWLDAKGYPNATRGRLENHFQEAHKREDAE